MMKTVLVTGGSRGIGAKMVRDFARAGFFVVFTYDRSEEEAAAIKAELKSQVLAIKANIANESEVANMFVAIKSKIGGIDILVNNAGAALSGLFQETSLTEMKTLFDTNFFGACTCIQHALPHMIAMKRGRIINIASIWGEIGAAYESVYAASKSALIGLTKSLSKELAPCGITVNAVSPGAIQTDMLNAYTAEELSALQSEIALRRLGQPCNISQMALFLASEKAGYITGQVIRIDGGMHM